MEMKPHVVNILAVSSPSKHISAVLFTQPSICSQEMVHTVFVWTVFIGLTHQRQVLYWRNIEVQRKVVRPSGSSLPIQNRG